MLSVQKCADQLREQAYKTLSPQIQSLEDELRDFNKLLAGGIRNIGYKLEALRNTELPATEPVLDDYLLDAIRKRDIEGEMLAAFSRGLRIKETQEEILHSLLDNAFNCYPRVALFTVRYDMFMGWSSRGFSDSTARTISSDKLNKADCSWLTEALMNRDQVQIAELPDTGSLRLMRDESQGEWLLYPLYVLDRPVAALLAGKAEDFTVRPETLAVLMDCTALRLENVALKIIKNMNEPAPASVETAIIAEEPSFADQSVPHETAEVLPDVLRLNLTVPIEIPVSLESVGKSHYEPDSARPNPLAELKLVEQTPEPIMEIPAAVSSEQTKETNVETEPAAADAAAPPPFQANPDDERLHEAAKRFAELLVSEIRLYNEDAVVEGRKNRDLYRRLYKNMNLNREMYEKRVAPTVSQRIDYLHEEFVRILGDGDAGMFGDDYPGSLAGKTNRNIRF